MKRVSVLLIASILSLSTIEAGSHPRGFPSRLDHDLQYGDMELAKIKEKYGLTIYRNYARDISRQNAATKTARLAARAQSQEGEQSSAYTAGILETFAKINWFQERFQCAMGFAYGLQFSNQREGKCYQSVSATIDAADTLNTLAFERWWDPTSYGDIMNTGLTLQNSVSSVNANCDLQKLINTLTTSPGQTFSTAAGRVTGGLLFELPEYYTSILSSTECFVLMTNMAKVSALVLDYHI